MDTTLLKRTSIHSGPVVLVAGATSLFMVLLGTNREKPVVAGPAPKTTAPATKSPSTKARVVERSSKAPVSRPTVERTTHTQLISAAGEHRPRVVTSSGPVPHSRPTTAPRVDTPSCSVGLSLLALKACLSLGK